MAQAQDNRPEWMTIDEAAQLLRMARITLRRMIYEGRLPASRPTRNKILISRDHIDQYMRERRVVQRA
jgi:excisionase family DNA binding protein